MDDQPLEDAAPGLRRSRDLAILAFLSLVTSMWMPWWRLRQTTPNVSDDVYAARVFVPMDGFTTWWPYATGVIIAIVTVWMFIRIAGRSIIYEPEAWRKDTIRWVILIVAAMLTVNAWPIAEFDLIGQRVIFAAGVSVHQDWRPALGYWSAGVAAVLLLVAWRMVPPVHQEPQAD